MERIFKIPERFRDTHRVHSAFAFNNSLSVCASRDTRASLRTNTFYTADDFAMVTPTRHRSPRCNLRSRTAVSRSRAPMEETRRLDRAETTS